MRLSSDMFDDEEDDESLADDAEDELEDVSDDEDDLEALPGEAQLKSKIRAAKAKAGTMSTPPGSPASKTAKARRVRVRPMSASQRAKYEGITSILMTRDDGRQLLLVR